MVGKGVLLVQPVDSEGLAAAAVAVRTAALAVVEVVLVEVEAVVLVVTEVLVAVLVLAITVAATVAAALEPLKAAPGRLCFIGLRAINMNYAWIENTRIRDIAPGNPAELYHPDVARHYDTLVPANAANGDGWVNGALVKPAPPAPLPPPEPIAPKPPTVSAIQYKMLFTSAERIAAKASTDPVVVDLQELLNDPRTLTVDLSLKSISDALDYMTSIKLLAAGRKAEILTGVPR